MVVPLFTILITKVPMYVMRICGNCFDEGCKTLLKAMGCEVWGVFLMVLRNLWLFFLSDGCATCHHSHHEGTHVMRICGNCGYFGFATLHRSQVQWGLDFVGFFSYRMVVLIFTILITMESMYVRNAGLWEFFI